jgi:hypothetical protein
MDMEEENKEIIKPSWLFSTMLYIFMVYIILKILGLFSGLDYFWNDAISQISIPLLIFSYLIDVFAFCYSFMAIYKALQRRPYSISMLKLSVFYLFFQSLFLLFRRLNGILFRLAYIYAFIPLFLLVFFVYLWRSKQLNKYIPKANRKFGMMGTLGIFIYFLVFIQFVITNGDPIIKTRNSMPVPVSEVSLQNGELTDGLAAYRPQKEWINDTIVGNEEDGISRIFHSEKCFHILLSTVKYDCKNKIDYYKVLSECCRSQIPDSIALEEVYNKDSLIGENRFYINSYRLRQNTDSTKYYWTFSALLDHSSYKIVILACSERDTLNASIDYSKQFMESVRFDLKE